MQDYSLLYRPQKLEQLIGQDVNKEILSALVKENRLYNAMIFYGRSGCGKTTTARILVNEMEAEKIELDASSNNSVDDARNIIDIASKLSLTGKHKIIIIDEAHMLSKSAWNALLKTIEEPNDKTHFIFCTTEYASIPATIRGRSQMFKFYSIPHDTLLSYAKHILELRHAQVEDLCLELIIKESHGQVRDLLKLLQIAVENSFTTPEKLAKWLAIPDVRGMGSYLTGVLTNNAKIAVKALKSLNTDLIEWRNRLEQLIYEILEDKYQISELNYTIDQVAKFRKLAQDVPDISFGKVLDYLLRINKAELAFQQLYVLATLGVQGC